MAFNKLPAYSGREGTAHLFKFQPCSLCSLIHLCMSLANERKRISSAYQQQPGSWSLKFWGQNPGLWQRKSWTLFSPACSPLLWWQAHQPSLRLGNLSSRGPFPRSRSAGERAQRPYHQGHALSQPTLQLFASPNQSLCFRKDKSISVSGYCSGYYLIEVSLQVVIKSISESSCICE